MTPLTASKTLRQQKHTTYIAATLLACSFGLSLGFSNNVFAQPELKGSPEELRQFLHPQPNVTSLHAEGEEKAYTNQAIVSLTFTTEDKLLSRSLSVNSDLRNQVTQQLITAGINAKDIKSAKFSSSPEYGWFGKNPDSYKVVNRMSITITEEKHLQELAKIADAHKEIQLTETKFKNTNEDKDKSKAKSNALAKIMQQKEIYETSLNVKLTATNFSEGQIYTSPSSRQLEEVIATNVRKSYSADEKLQSAVQQEPAASFDEVIYKANIYVNFIVESNKSTK